MQLPIGKYYHKSLDDIVEVTPLCIEMSKRAPMDTTSTFVEHDGDVKEVTESLLVDNFSYDEEKSYLEDCDHYNRHGWSNSHR